MTITPMVRQAAIEWLRQIPQPWDLACRWHGSKSLRIAQGGWNADWLQQELRVYFNKLDRIVLKTSCRKRQERIPRVVALEYCDDGGWHAHAIVRAPTGYSPERLSGLMDRLWNARMRKSDITWETADLFWSGPVEPGYLAYILKDTWKFSNEKQWDNFHGFLELDLTYTGQ